MLPGILLLDVLFLHHVHANEELLRLSTLPAYRVMPGGNTSNWNYSELDQINNRNIGRLQAAWTLATGNLQGHAGSPLVLPSSATRLTSDIIVLHTAAPETILAINLDTLEKEWIYEADSGTAGFAACCTLLNRGTAYANGRIFLYQSDNNLVALDVRNGKPAWITPTADLSVLQTRVNAPLTVKDYVITANPGNDSPGQGWLGAYRTRDGTLMWQANSVGSDAEVLFNADTSNMRRPVGLNSRAQDGLWLQESGSIGGVLAWDSAENLVYYVSSVVTESGSGATGRGTRYQTTLFARDIDTGMARWIYPLTAGGDWPFDDADDIHLVDLIVNDQPVAALVYFSQSGFVFTLNRGTGELLSAEKYNDSTNWADGIEQGTGEPIRISATGSTDAGASCPAASDTAGFAGPAYSPHTGFFYLPLAFVCQQSTGSSIANPVGGMARRQPVVSYLAAARLADGRSQGGQIIAWDPARARIAWTIPERRALWGRALATAGAVVFYGTLDGYARAVDAQTGRYLWQFKVPSGILGTFSTWIHKDKQFVGILSGKGTLPEDIYNNKELSGETMPGGTLTVFSLP